MWFQLAFIFLLKFENYLIHQKMFSSNAISKLSCCFKIMNWSLNLIGSRYFLKGRLIFKINKLEILHWYNQYRLKRWEIFTNCSISITYLEYKKFKNFPLLIIFSVKSNNLTSRFLRFFHQIVKIFRICLKCNFKGNFLLSLLILSTWLTAFRHSI